MGGQVFSRLAQKRESQSREALIKRTGKEFKLLCHPASLPVLSYIPVPPNSIERGLYGQMLPALLHFPP